MFSVYVALYRRYCELPVSVSFLLIDLCPPPPPPSLISGRMWVVGGWVLLPSWNIKDFLSENLDLTLSYSFSHSSTRMQSNAHISGWNMKHFLLEIFGNLIHGLFSKSQHHTLILGARIGALSSIYYVGTRRLWHFPSLWFGCGQYWRSF